MRDTYKLKAYNVKDLETRIAELILDDEITNKKGIYLYVLDGQEKHLNLRTFTEVQKIKAFNKQKGKCPRVCLDTSLQPIRLGIFWRMETHHITPWHVGGGNDSNYQVLKGK